MTDQDVTAAALNEVKSPMWVMTEQFFEIHALKEADPVALVERVQDDLESNPAWRVYLNLENVHYYFQITLQSQRDSLRVIGCNSSEHASVRLNIFSDLDSPDQIGRALGLPASRKGYKGDLKFGPRSTKLRDDHFYSFEAQAPTAWDFEQKLKRLLETLLPKRQQLEGVCQRSTSCMINVAYYAWQSQMWGCHLSTDTISMLSSLGVALDIDLYAEGLELL